MTKRVAVVGINLKRLKGEFGTCALSFSGNNFGNMLFTNAVYNQIQNCSHLDFIFDPIAVRKDFDHIVIPASNWINVTEDWGFLADALEEADLPVCIVGLGSQLNSLEEIFDIPDGSKRLIKVVSERSKNIAVRGHFTKTALNVLGFDNVVALGCPSIFIKNRVPEIRVDFSKKRLRLGVGPTRYELKSFYNPISNDKQRDLYRFALRYAQSIYYQSEAFEISYLNRENIVPELDSAMQYYGVDDVDDFEDMIMTKGMYHKDLDQWLSDVVKDDIYIGTRIHGAVAAILAGTPAILLTHDNRTLELAEIMGVPNMKLNDFHIGFSRLNIVSLNALVKYRSNN